MCGIAAVLGQDDTNLAKSMVANIAHRGPDGFGTWSDDYCSLGHARLSIVDLIGSNQPIGSEHGCWLVQNGEIYNFDELRKKYHSYNWVTKGDSAVILAAHNTNNNSYIPYAPLIHRSHLFYPYNYHLISVHHRKISR